MKAMKHIVLTIFALACFAVAAPSSYACFCIFEDVPDSFERATAVFLGEVTEIIEPKSVRQVGPLADRLHTVRFRVRKSWKGILFGRDSFDVLSAQTWDGCFSVSPLRKGATYLVYANPVAGRTNLGVLAGCNRTSELKFGFKPLNADEVDPFQDMKELDVLALARARFQIRPIRKLNSR
jgi:hypothetical protein